MTLLSSYILGVCYRGNCSPLMTSRNLLNTLPGKEIPCFNKEGQRLVTSNKTLILSLGRVLHILSYPFTEETGDYVPKLLCARSISVEILGYKKLTVLYMRKKVALN